MVFKTLGDLRELTEGLPDSTPIAGSVGPDTEDALTDAGIDFAPETAEAYGSVETRCDGIRRLYLACDMVCSLDGMDEEDEYDGDLEELLCE